MHFFHMRSVKKLLEIHRKSVYITSTRTKSLSISVSPKEFLEFGRKARNWVLRWTRYVSQT